MPNVYNKKRPPYPRNAVFIGRPSPWQNPFVLGSDGTRDEVCDKFEEWIMKPEQLGLRARAELELHGKDLLCFCHSKRCHGLTWLRIVNE
jgi:hypothetical protein